MRAADLSDPRVSSLVPCSRAEDILLSHHYACAYGLDAMRQTPHAIVYTRTPQSEADLIKQVSRTRSDLERLYAAHPPYRLLQGVFSQEIYDDGYATTLARAERQAVWTDEWLRIESTK